jgi:hypothetical protein
VNYQYDSFHLEEERARKNLSQVFQTGANGSVDCLPLPERRSPSQPWSSAKLRTRSGGVSHKRKDNDWTERDMSSFSFVLMLLLLGLFMAAHSDRPVFWLLVGPGPLAIGFTLATFVRRGFLRQLCSKEKEDSAASNS